jgi:acyl-[acyl carrier protein]--UDP-N-acetylglucosamine O-acyltransferase
VRALLFGLVFVSPPFLKGLLLRWFCGAKVGYRARIGWFSSVVGRRVELGAHSVIRPFTLIRLAGELTLGSYSEISSFTLIYGSSSLIVGDHSYIGPQSLINAEEEVRLGQGSALGARSMVYTHGSFLPYTEGYWIKLAGVTIGDKVWCAAGGFIHPGVEIGDDTFVNSRSVLTRSVPPGSVVEGNPAQVICRMERMKRRMSPRRLDAALSQLLRSFAEIGLRRELGIEAVEESKYQLRFRWRGEAYRVALIPSMGDLPAAGEPDSGVHQILLVNRPGWSPLPGAAVFDLATMRTPFTSGRIATVLRLFMQRYYGIKFRDQLEH